MSTRDINLGKVVGLSSYELAVKTGVFSGTLEEYLNKEQFYYNKMVEYGESIRSDIDVIKTEIDDIKERLNTLENK